MNPKNNENYSSDENNFNISIRLKHPPHETLKKILLRLQLLVHKEVSPIGVYRRFEVQITVATNLVYNHKYAYTYI